MKLFLDDKRNAPDGWTLAKTAKEAIDLITNNVIEEVSLDFDLGDGNGDGEDVILFIGERVMSGVMKMPITYIHSMNPVGRRAMQSVIDDIDKYLKEKIDE